MFNKDFYPTPREVIERMLSGIDIANNVFLEPSAGKGNIIDYLNEQGAKEVLSCEINHDLAKIAASKSRLIANDFLAVQATEVSHIHIFVVKLRVSYERGKRIFGTILLDLACYYSRLGFNFILLCNQENAGKGRRLGEAGRNPSCLCHLSNESKH